MSAQGQDTIYQMVTDTVIAALKAGTVPWRKRWNTPGYLPTSMRTGKPYRGINNFLLNLAPYNSPYWGTFKRIKELGGQVRKGERSTTVVFWKRLVIEDKATGDDKLIFLLRYYRVFNAEQADGLPDKFYPKPDDGHAVEHFTDADEAIEKYLANDGPSLTRVASDSAGYAPELDAMILPLESQFDTPQAMYGNTFHEVVHSTGHSKRLNRPGIVDFDHFGSQQYAREELVAEMGSAMVLAVFGIDVQHEYTATYVANWLHALENDHKLVIKAAGEAQKAADLILGTTFDNGDEEE